MAEYATNEQSATTSTSNTTEVAYSSLGLDSDFESWTVLNDAKETNESQQNDICNVELKPCIAMKAEMVQSPAEYRNPNTIEKIKKENFLVEFLGPKLIPEIEQRFRQDVASVPDPIVCLKDIILHPLKKRQQVENSSSGSQRLYSLGTNHGDADLSDGISIISETESAERLSPELGYTDTQTNIPLQGHVSYSSKSDESKHDTSKTGQIAMEDNNDLIYDDSSDQNVTSVEYIVPETSQNFIQYNDLSQILRRRRTSSTRRRTAEKNNGWPNQSIETFRERYQKIIKWCEKIIAHLGILAFIIISIWLSFQQFTSNGKDKSTPLMEKFDEILTQFKRLELQNNILRDDITKIGQKYDLIVKNQELHNNKHVHEKVLKNDFNERDHFNSKMDFKTDYKNNKQRHYSNSPPRDHSLNDNKDQFNKYRDNQDDLMKTSIAYEKILPDYDNDVISISDFSDHDDGIIGIHDIYHDNNRRDMNIINDNKKSNAVIYEHEAENDHQHRKNYKDYDKSNNNYNKYEKNNKNGKKPDKKHFTDDDIKHDKNDKNKQMNKAYESKKNSKGDYYSDFAYDEHNYYKHSKGEQYTHSYVNNQDKLNENNEKNEDGWYQNMMYHREEIRKLYKDRNKIYDQNKDNWYVERGNGRERARNKYEKFRYVKLDN